MRTWLSEIPSESLCATASATGPIQLTQRRATLGIVTEDFAARVRTTVAAAKDHAARLRNLPEARHRRICESGQVAGAHRMPADLIRAALRTPRSDVRKPYQVLNETEIARMLDAAANPRDRAIVACLLGAGLRVSELVALDVGEVIEGQDGAVTLHVASGKGRRTRAVPVQPEVAAAIRRYLQAIGRRLGQQGPLFRSHDRGASRRDRKRLTARAVGLLVQKADPAGGHRR